MGRRSLGGTGGALVEDIEGDGEGNEEGKVPGAIVCVRRESEGGERCRERRAGFLKGTEARSGLKNSMYEI